MDNASDVGGGRIGAANILVGLLETTLGRVPRALALTDADLPALKAAAHQAAEQGTH
jgi:hypothetical protein